MPTQNVNVRKLSCFDGLALKTASCQNQTFPAHFHDTFAIAIIEKGIEILDYDNRQTIAPAQTIAAINPLETHSHKGFDDALWQYSAFYLSADIFHFLLQKQGISPKKDLFLPPHAFENPTLFSCIKTLFEAKEEAAVYDLMGKICFQLSQHTTEKPTFLTQFRAADIEEAKYLLQNADINLAQLAARFRLDKFAFLRKFKHLTGMTPMRYQMIFRIAKAKKLLQTQMPLTDITYECGFYDQSHFIHYFKKSEGMTPLSFRLLNRF